MIYLTMKMSHSSTHYDFLVLSVLVDQIPQCHKLPHSLEKNVVFSLFMIMCQFLYLFFWGFFFLQKEQTIMDFRELLT